MFKKAESEIKGDLAIAEMHKLTTGILTATILFMMLRYDKNFERPKIKYIVTIIAILFCLLGIIMSGYSLLAAMIDSKSQAQKFSGALILNKIPILTSSLLLVISILLFYTVIFTSIKFIKREFGITKLI